MVEVRKKKGSFWFGMDAEEFYPAFNKELDDRLQIIKKEIQTHGSLITKCPLWSYMGLSLTMLFLVVLTVLAWLAPLEIWADLSFYGSLVILLILIIIDRARKGA